MSWTIDTTNMCSHLQKKLFDEEGVYHHLWLSMQDDPELTAVVNPDSFIFIGMGRRCWFWQENQLQKSLEKIRFVIYYEYKT